MTRTITGNTARRDLAPFADKLTQYFGVLVIDFDLFVRAEPTYLASDHEPSPARTSFFLHLLTTVGSWSESFLYHDLFQPHYSTGVGRLLVLGANLPFHR